jgi:superfamily II DNA or RNA helicase
MRPAIVSGAMKIPLETLDVLNVDVEDLQAQATYRYRPLGLADDEPDLEVEAYYFEGDFLCLPREFGLTVCNQLHIPYEDHTSLGYKAKFPKVPTPREYQVPQINQIVDTFNDYWDFIFRAHTGWGKTVGALIVAARLGRTTLIVVDQDNLKVQWIKCLKELFGFKDEDIGLIQGKKSTFKGKSVCVAMVQTLSRKELPEGASDYFGTVLLDEVHTLGAPTFSWVLLLFNAAYRLGVSATPKRKDGLQKALDHNLGKIRVAADKKHDRSAVYIVRHETVYSFYGNVSKMTGRIFSELTEDGPRNMTIVEAAMWLFESGRDVLILSDRIEHLKELQCMLYYMGVEWDDLGLYTGYDPIWKFTKDPKPKSRPKDLHRWKNDKLRWEFAPYTPVSMQVVQKRIPKARFPQILANCRIVLATYGMFAKGVDCPRLSGGVDATPRGTAEQVHGRILREEDGKPIPIWVTLADVNSYRLMYSFGNRIKDYLKSNGILFEWLPDGRIESCDAKVLKAEIYDRVDDLKSMRIVTNKDGLNTLVTSEDEKKRKRTSERDIIQRFRK